MNEYYVYGHTHPETSELFYIGMGRRERAYMMGSGGNRTTQRSKDHNQYMISLIERGYIPHEWVYFYGRDMEKSSARRLENYLIKKYNPVFNRKHGPKVMFSEAQIKQIKHLKQQGLSDTKVSKIMGCSQTTISRMITGVRSGYKDWSSY